MGGKDGVLANESMVCYFRDFEALTIINLSALDTSKTTSMREIFLGVSKLTNIDLNNFDTFNVTNMDGMVFTCRSLTNLDLTRFNTSKVISMDSTFYGCINVSNKWVIGLSTTITEKFKNWGTDHVTII